VGIYKHILFKVERWISFFNNITTLEKNNVSKTMQELLLKGFEVFAKES